MDAMHKVYSTHEAKHEIPEIWGLDDPMVRRGSFLVVCDNLIGIVYDSNFPHTRKTLKARHDWENFEWQNILQKTVENGTNSPQAHTETQKMES
jgi:hypothetical protein